MIDLASQFDYQTAPLAQNIVDATGMRDYATRARAMFLCARGIPLDSVDRESIGQFELGLALARQIIRRAGKRAKHAVGR